MGSSRGQKELRKPLANQTGGKGIIKRLQGIHLHLSRRNENESIEKSIKNTQIVTGYFLWIMYFSPDLLQSLQIQGIFIGNK